MANEKHPTCGNTRNVGGAKRHEFGICGRCGRVLRVDRQLGRFRKHSTKVTKMDRDAAAIIRARQYLAAYAKAVKG